MTATSDQNTSTPISPDEKRTAIGLRERFRFSQLNRWALWPLWVGGVLASMSLLLNWSESWTVAGRINCDYGGCPDASAASYYLENAGIPASAADAGVLYPALAAIIILVAWAAHRRDIGAPNWFKLAPMGALVVLGGAALLHIGGVFEGWAPPGGDISGVGYSSSEPATGVMVMLIALLPLWFGIARVRRHIGELPVDAG